MKYASFAVAICSAWLSAVTGFAHAQEFPTKPIRLVVGFAAGGSSDTVARIVAQKLTEAFGHNVVVDNRPGAGGTIAADLVVKAQPDGYTLYVGDFGPNAIAGSLYTKLPYDPATDFAHVTQIVSFPTVLLVPATSPVTGLKELIDLARAKPGILKYSSPGIGTSPHVFVEMMNLKARINTVPIHYKGAAPALVGMLAGEGDYTVTSVSTALAHIKAGRIRALGVSSLNSIPRLPNVPPISSVLPGYDAISFHGLHAPARTPRHIVSKLQQEVAKALARPEVKERFDGLAMDTAGSTPDEFTAFIRKQIDTWAPVVRTANIRAD